MRIAPGRDPRSCATPARRSPAPDAQGAVHVNDLPRDVGRPDRCQESGQTSELPGCPPGAAPWRSGRSRHRDGTELPNPRVRPPAGGRTQAHQTSPAPRSRHRFLATSRRSRYWVRRPCCARRARPLGRGQAKTLLRPACLQGSPSRSASPIPAQRKSVQRLAAPVSSHAQAGGCPSWMPCLIMARSSGLSRCW